MELLADGAWQWRPQATLTAADSSNQCTVFALQYSDCAVLRVRWNSDLPTKSRFPDSQSDSERDLELHGHSERVVCVKIYDRDLSIVAVCSASRDCVIVWRITDNSRVKQLVLVEILPAEPGWVTFDDTGTLVAVASERDVKVFVIERKEVLVTLEGHLARVTRGEFHPIHHHLLITASEDRTFKIWDIAERKLWFQSAVLSAFSILSIAVNPVNGDAAFGFADGSVKVFAVLDGYAKELTTLNIQNFIQKSLRKKQKADREVNRQKPQVISSLPIWARSENAQRLSTGISTSASYTSIGNPSQPDPSDDDENTEVSCPILSMKYLCVNRLGSRLSNSSNELQFNDHRDQELLDYIQFLAVGIPGFLLSVNAYSFEVTIVHDFQQCVERMDSRRQVLDPICVAKDFCFYHAPRSNVLHCGVTSAFQPCFTMLNATTPYRGVNTLNSGNQVSESNRTREQITPCKERDTLDNSSERVSVIPRNPPPKDSVLNLPPLSTKKTPPKSAKNLDKPVTFHTRIKSSGYGSSSTPFGCRRTSPKSRTMSRKSNSDSRAKGVSSTPTSAFMKEYPTNCGLLQHFQPKHALPPKTLHQGVILHIEYSSDAKWLATSGNDRVAQVCKLPFSRFGGEGNVFIGHDQAVRAVHWSQNDQMLVTVGSDKTSRLWFADSDTSSLTFQGVAPPSSVAATAAAMGSMSSAKKATRQEIVAANFFYMDKFLLSACGNLARLHQFELDEMYVRASKAKSKKRNDIDILENQSRKKRVAQWSFDDMQSVTSLTCVNGAFLSSVAVIAGSDRSLRVLDVGAGGGGRTVRVVRDAHGRAAHTVALPRPTCYASHPSNFYDLLLSSAPDSTIHLWDIRADNCVMRFCEHVNRVHTLGVAFSPCMRFVATGSEDRAAYIYDIRTGRRLTKLKGHSDVVTSVAFSPLHPQLATASCDGTVRFYSSEVSD